MADSTTLAEASQALFCSLADFALVKRANLDKLFDPDTHITYDDFKYAWEQKYTNNSVESIFKKHSDTGKIKSLKELENFLQDTDWYRSSVLIAKKLVEDIDKVVVGFKGIKKPSLSEIWYVRGDNEVMGNIAELFKHANKTQKDMNSVQGMGKSTPIGDINKWSPADIYFATDKARDEISEAVSHNKGTKGNGYTFDDLNTMVNDLISSGDLLPLSLKKQTRQVTLVKVNFDKRLEAKQISKYAYYGRSQWKPREVKNLSEKSLRGNPRDLKLYFESTAKDEIKLRHDASSNAFKAEFLAKDAEARGGSIGSIDIFCQLLAIVDKAVANKILAAYNAGNTQFKKELAKIPKPKASDKAAKDLYDIKRGNLSAIHITNNIFPILIKWLDRKTPVGRDQADKFIRMLYQYVTSRLKESGRFIIAK